MGSSESGAVCPRPSGPGTEQRTGWQHWQMGNVIALERAFDQIRSLHTEGEIIFFL